MAGRIDPRSWRWLATGGLVILCGCATTVTGSSAHRAPVLPSPQVEAQRRAFIQRVQLRFPQGLYLVGFGVGSTPQQAEDDAKVRAASNISSEIRANLNSLQSEQTVGGRTTSGVAVTEDVVQKVTTDAGAFIQVRPELTQLIGDNYEAVAVASREELDGKYERESEGMLQKVLADWDTALKNQDGPIQSISAALCDARGIVARLDAIDQERWLVAGHGVWTAEAMARRKQVEALRARLRAIKVSIVRTPQTPGVDEALSQAVAAQGYPVDLIPTASCAGIGLVIAVAGQDHCSNTMLGVRCDAILTANANRCGATDSLFSETSNDGVGMNATDQDTAARVAMRQVNLKKFARQVADLVSRSVEGECGK